ncbi:MAG TPA: hypothetical protein PKH75_10135, partial [Bacillota bacterium]|nr:hypothetical protein [Bacillota bacterium]HQD81031.1 hypothetical protein [Bacillota bacterium]
LNKRQVGEVDWENLWKTMQLGLGFIAIHHAASACRILPGRNAYAEFLVAGRPQLLLLATQAIM